ncbi:Crp/Fnr family transcriptional regulator [Desulfonema ishimotonii]|uniref:Crp/Fnr family transcriptional regulator n=1 Tax=Desulfonema ishimotonii TaxID=45657 RepID=A0A401G3T7_9BACT|nr:DUF4388 domain-containing protein [Desulfonema ishimotonii]GBC63899.1 Crp/Fnr family transcriptional regulator [Desulfonema ishimotonii]
MNMPDTILEIIKDNHCPIYKAGDAFRLSGRVLTLPPGKPACMVLAEDIKTALTTGRYTEDIRQNNCPVYQFNCSGPVTDCTGSIRMEYRLPPDTAALPADGEKAEKIRAIINVLARFPIFQGLDDGQLRDLGRYLKYSQLPRGTVIIKKGTPGVNLFIIAAGKVEVIGDDAMRIAWLGRGEVFGEMSLISGEPVGATIKVVEPVRLLYMKGRDFGKILSRYPTLQMYFARLLAQRLAATNMARSEDFSSGMAGKLSEVPPSELFQTLNVNQKTGGADLALSGGNARVCFRQGEPVWAEYKGKNGPDAFFEILKAKEGRFRFSPNLSPEEAGAPEMGEFMWLLMEGIRRMDEDHVT